MSDHYECLWTGQVFDLAEQLSEARGRIRELEQLADPELDANWCAVWQKVCAENEALEARIAAALVRLDADPLQTGLREDVRRALTPGVSE